YLFEDEPVYFGKALQMIESDTWYDDSSIKFDTFKLKFTRGNPRAYVETFGSQGSGKTFKTDIESAEETYNEHRHDYSDDDDDDDDEGSGPNDLP
ncbi:MAG: hypothetical protein ACLFNK_03030, partial [Candidatus Woesearchaeota archaeon]